MGADPIDALLGPEEQAFRAEVRAFIRDTLPAQARRNADLGRHATKDEVLQWQRALYAKGWAAPTWPKEYGGTGWDPVRLYLFTLECGLGSAPKVPAFGTKMIGPVLYTFGSKAQKDFYLPRIQRAEDWWCQGFSEPGAGSDLAALQTRADRVGDRWIVNGQKIWTTKAQHANRMFALVRTGGGTRRQEGISMLLIDMDSPGIELRPIIGIDGSHSLNEVFLTDVSVPVENLVGEAGRGWDYARFLLANERSDITGVGRSRRQLARLRGLAADADAGLLAQIAEADIALTALELTELRYLAAQARGEGIGAGASILKLRGTEIQQELTRLLREALGADALRHGAAPGEGAEGVLEEYLYNRASTIYGGSSEIQRGLIARAALAEGA
ncbi:acyl-CoA dehydrogenase family protein [Pararhodobacter sp. CCB-MM2]|uniref:acyl-CoA dehydrogenase family protein n=1 Tax=Pararhodobacter sp. CCB-MM2 TaxID=1786003 RepID=UPI0008355F57|nr:acyl-CoA dehydrogenase family protein [Pararhodobacter sp. CCB-MM2]